MRKALLLVLGALLCQFVFAQNELLDSLRNGIESNSGLDKLPYLDEMAWQLVGSDPGKGAEYAKEAFAIATEMGDSVAVANAANTYGACLIRSGEYELALDINHRALKLRKEYGSDRDVGSSLSKIGLIYQEQSRLDSAIPYQIQALKMFESAADSGAIAQTYINLSSLFERNQDLDKAIEYAELGLDIAQKLNFSYAIAGNLGNLSMLWDKKGDYDKAVEYGEQALEIFRDINSRNDIANQLNNLGFYERKRKNDLKALEYYKQAFAISDEMGDKYGRAKYRANIAATNVTLGNFKEAESLYRTSLKEAEEAQLYSVVWQCEEGLSNALEGQGKFAEALPHYKKFKSIQDSLFTEEKNAVIQELEIRYQTEKKEQENLALQQENEIYALENERSRTLLFGSIGLLILLSISGVLFYSRQKVKQENQLQEEVIKEREKGLEAVITATEEERKRIAKDLHDGIGQQLSGLKLAWQKLSSDLQPKASEEAERMDELGDILDETCSEVRSISHQMMPKALSEMGLVPAIDDMLRKSIGPTDIRYRFEHFKAEGRFKESIEIGLYRICQELINNVIKHSGATELSVQLFRNKDYLVMIVEDNGKGFDMAKSADGIGLMNISGRLNTVHGDVNYEPSPGSGTVATIRVPIQ